MTEPSGNRTSVQAEAALLAHTPGEFVDGLGWSCLTCDSFGCSSAHAEAVRLALCSRRGCGRPPSEHEMGRFCP
jgi:hypothetical protein